MSLAAVPDPGDLTADEAEALTERIKAHIRQAWMDITEAWERRAHLALGYPSFAAYVETEFDMKRAHAYRLIDQGRVIRELTAAAGMSPMGDTDAPPIITEREARDVKPHLEAVAKDVTERVAAGDAPGGAISSAVAKAREDAAAIRALNDLAPEGFDVDADRAKSERIQTVFMAAERVLALGDPTTVVAELSDYHAYHRTDVAKAAAWFACFVGAWEEPQ